MTSTTPLEQISQLPNPDELIELLVIDASALVSSTGVAGDIFYISPYPMDVVSPGDIVWGGQPFTAIPMSISGFLTDSQGTAPQPKLSLANIGGVFSSALLDYNDLKGAIVTRFRTYKRYLDNGSEPDSTIYMNPDIYRIDQKTNEDNVLVEWNLGTAIDQQGVLLPGGLVLKHICTRTYRFYINGAFSYQNVSCPYTGTNYFTSTGVATSDPAKDVCSRLTATGCLLRFPPPTDLPTWAFEGVANGN